MEAEEKGRTDSDLGRDFVVMSFQTRTEKMGGRQEVKLQHAGTCCDHAEPASLVKVCLSHTPTFLLVLYFDTTGRDTMPLLSSAC